jgi:hypothetical protein
MLNLEQNSLEATALLGKLESNPPTLNCGFFCVP